MTGEKGIEKQCRNCNHAFNANDGLRFCRRFPPQVYRSYVRGDIDGWQINSEFPMVVGVESCGEFTPKQSEPTDKTNAT